MRGQQQADQLQTQELYNLIQVVVRQYISLERQILLLQIIAAELLMEGQVLEFLFPVQLAQL